jgi:hypothetical protein
MLYFLSDIFSLLKKVARSGEETITLGLLNGLFLFLWIFYVAPSDWSVMLFSAWALVFAVGSFVAFRMSSQISSFYVYGSVAAAFVGAATADLLSGNALIIAFTIEIALILGLVWSLTKDYGMLSRITWLFLVPVFLSSKSVSEYMFASEVFTENFFAILILAVVLVFSARFVKGVSATDGSSNQVKTDTVLFLVGILYFGFLIWQVTHIILDPNQDLGTMLSLLIFTVLGLWSYFSGLYGNDQHKKTFGAAVLGFVVLRMVLVDVWDMELFGRVITFGAIGALLMSTAFLTNKKKHESSNVLTSNQ